MPTSVGELEARVPSMAVTGLQRNVIAMAFCCKKGRWSISGRTIATANNYTAMVLSITVLRRDEIVAVVPPPAGSASSGDVTPSRKHSFLKLNDLASSRAHSRNCHNGKSTDFEQTLGPGTTINLNALTCYGLVSSEVSHRIATMVSRWFVL